MTLVSGSNRAALPHTRQGPAVFFLHVVLLAGVAFTVRAADQGPPPGFQSLFDEMSLVGWHTEPRISVPKTAAESLAALAQKPEMKGPIAAAQAEAKGRWEIHDDFITGGQDERRMKHGKDGEDWGLGSWLMTDETYGDFELQLDANPDWPCDTGIYVRTTRQGHGFQILLDHRGDDTSGIGGGIGFLYLRGIGGIEVTPYNFRWTLGADGQPKDVNLIPRNNDNVVTKMAFAATSEDFRKAWRMNDWNHFRIRVVGNLPRITVWINDTKICDCYTAAIQHPAYDPVAVKKLLGPRGHIAFEVHDGPPWRWGPGKVSRWRNIYIRPL